MILDPDATLQTKPDAIMWTLLCTDVLRLCLWIHLFDSEEIGQHGTTWGKSSCAAHP